MNSAWHMLRSRRRIGGFRSEVCWDRELDMRMLEKEYACGRLWTSQMGIKRKSFPSLPEILGKI